MGHTLESVTEPIKRIAELRGDTPRVEITIGGDVRSPADAARFAAAGVDRLIVSPAPLPEAIDGLRRFAEALFYGREWISYAGDRL